MADFLSIVFAAIIFVIGFGLGGSITVDDCKRSSQNFTAMAVGWLSQFFFMPLCTFLVSQSLQLGVLEAAGLILCGCAPGGGSSNLFVLWAGGDVSLSVVMTTASTICAAFMFPLNVFIYIRFALNTKTVKIEWWGLFSGMFLMLGGTFLGMATCHAFGGGQEVRKWITRLGSVVGGIFMGIAVVAAFYYNYHLLFSGYKLWIGAWILEPLGILFGLGLSTLCGLPIHERIAIAMETGVQNLAFVIAIIKLSFSPQEQEDVLRFPYVVCLAYIFWTAFFIAIFWALPKSENVDEKEIEMTSQEKKLEPDEEDLAPAVAVIFIMKIEDSDGAKPSSAALEDVEDDLDDGGPTQI